MCEECPAKNLFIDYKIIKTMSISKGTVTLMRLQKNKIGVTKGNRVEFIYMANKTIDNVLLRTSHIVSLDFLFF